MGNGQSIDVRRGLTDWALMVESQSDPDDPNPTVRGWQNVSGSPMGIRYQERKDSTFGFTCEASPAEKSGWPQMA